MGIIKTDFGNHKDILVAEFGTGDICFAQARRIENSFETQLIFTNHEQREIGSISSEWNGKTTDEIGDVKIVFDFKNPESITALVHSLLALQKEVFKQQKARQRFARI
jgi:hypothetical protein